MGSDCHSGALSAIVHRRGLVVGAVLPQLYDGLGLPGSTRSAEGWPTPVVRSCIVEASRSVAEVFGYHEVFTCSP
jgi:hypothetical protein